MYHGRFKNSHYEAGFNWGNLLYKHGKKISNNHTFTITEERSKFVKECIPIYKQYYPEILDEIRGLAVCLTFIYPTIIKPGLNAGMLVRYLLEKCKTVSECICALNELPIASQQTLTIADKSGNIAVIECSCNHVEVIHPNQDGNFVTTANEFVSEKMKGYNNYHVDNWKAEERYLVSYNALKEAQNNFSFDLIRDILSGQYGFMCQYDRKLDADTVWSVIYDIRNSEIYRAEGNPKRKTFKKEPRLKFKV